MENISWMRSCGESFFFPLQTLFLQYRRKSYGRSSPLQRDIGKSVKPLSFSSVSPGNRNLFFPFVFWHIEEIGFVAYAKARSGSVSPSFFSLFFPDSLVWRKHLALFLWELFLLHELRGTRRAGAFPPYLWLPCHAVEDEAAQDERDSCPTLLAAEPRGGPPRLKLPSLSRSEDLESIPFFLQRRSYGFSPLPMQG